MTTKEVSKRYYEKHKQEILEKSRNSEHRKNYQIKWRAEHADQIKSQHKEYYASHREERAAKSRIYRANTKEQRKIRAWIYNLKTKYGLSESRYLDLLKSQDNKCAICGNEFVRIPHVDHDHVTGKIRGLLCSNCNTGIGLLQNSPSILSKAIVYLDKSLGL